MSEEEKNKFQTTTISTIAIQSEKTRIVIALLQSKNLLELKILELVPNLTLLGETFEEASELEVDHNHVLQQLQSKQSPVEELLRKADQVIADQKPQAEIYVAMADSLGQAWKDINSLLILRKDILHLNVTYHSKTEACLERMRDLELLCLSPVPSSEEMIKDSLECMQEIKKSMLECLMGALKAGQNLLFALNEIATDERVDSTPRRHKKMAQSAIAQVEKWMEELHNRRQLLDATWQRRKINLEKYKTLTILKYDLELLEIVIKERYELLSRNENELGDSVSSAESLLKQHLQLVPEAMTLQEEGLRMLKASQRLPSSSHKFSEESRRMSYNVLNLANEYLQAVNEREELLNKSVHFFNSAKNATLKLEEMNYQLKNVNSNSEKLIIMSVTDEMIKNVINDGHYILEKTPKAKGIRYILDKMENTKYTLMSNCTKTTEENFEISQITNNLYEKHNEILSWLVTTIESVIEKHSDLGDGLLAAQNFVLLHQKLLNDLKTQDSYLDAKRAQLCVETVLEHFANIKSNIEKKWNIWERTSVHEKNIQTQWIRNMADSKNTIDWVIKLESQLYPVLNSETIDTDAQIQQVNDKLNNIIPEIKRVQQEIQLRIETAKELIAQGTLENDEVPPKLNELYNSVCTIIVEYTIFLEMFVSFLKNVKELEIKINDLKKTCDQIMEPNAQQVNEMKIKHIAASKVFYDFWNTTYSESQRIIDKIKQQEPNSYVEKDIRSVNNLLESKKLEWDNLSSRLEQTLKRWQILKQFDQDLESINTSIKELTEELSSLQHQYGLSLSAAKSSSVAFPYFEKTIQILEKKIESFINTAEEVFEVSESKCKEIENQLNQLKDRWNKFCTRVTETRHFINLSIQYFTLIEETEECFREGTKLLVSVAKKSFIARTSEETEDLLKEIQTFMKSIQQKQEERISFISELVSKLFNDEEHSKQVSQIITENNDMLDSFSTVSKELNTLQQKLKTAFPVEEDTKENVSMVKTISVNELSSISGVQNVDIVEISDKKLPEIESLISVSPSSPPFKKTKFFEELNESQKPIFISTLKDGRVTEGSNFVFECEVKGYPKPKVMWLKEGLSIENKPGYRTSLQNGLCKLAIEEVFTTDSATFTCRATNEAGTTDTTAFLTVLENNVDEKLLPPSFVIPLSDISAEEKENCEFYCKVSGIPLPIVQWFKDDICIDSHPAYETTYINGDAKLLIKNVKLDDSAIYSCSAVNKRGTISTSARLTVKTENKSTEPPFFSSPLSNSMVRTGQKLKLECEVYGKPYPKLSWFHNGEPLKELPNKINSIDENGKIILIILEASPDDAGTYVLVASNDAGETSCSCYVFVKNLSIYETPDSEITNDTEPIKPSINFPLTDQTVTKGFEAILECVIIGQPEPEVIWYCNEIPIKESENIQLFFKGDKCSLHIRETCIENDGIYKVIAINSAGETSTSCRLIVQELSESICDVRNTVKYSPPKFKKLLTDILIREGDTAILECAVSGFPQPEIKWFLNKNEIKFSDRIRCERDIDGNVTLTVQNVIRDDKGLYTIRASNSVGEAKCFSHVIVKSLSSLDSKSSEIHLENKYEPPSFVESFSDQIVTENESAKFECIVKGKPFPKVKWFFNDEPVSGKSFLVSTSGNRQVLYIPEATQKNIGVIKCTAENDFGKVSHIANLRLTESVTIDNLLPTLDTTMNVFESNKSFEMKKSIFSKYSKQNDEVPITKTDSYLSASEKIFEKINDNEPNKVEARHLEEHRESNGKLSDYSSQSISYGNFNTQNEIETNKQYTMTALKPARKQTAPRFLSTINGVIVDEGRNVKFEAIVESYPAADISWYKNNEKLCNLPGKIKIMWELNRATLEVFNVQNNNAGRYTCSASNDAGQASCSADLFVKKTAFPPVMAKRLHPQSIAVGKRITFEIEVTSTPPPSVIWYKDDVQLAKISPFYRLREQGNSFALIIEKVRLEDSGQYKVRAFNEAGEAVSVATLNIFEAPKSVIDDFQISQNINENSLFDKSTISNKFDKCTKYSEVCSGYNSEFSKVIETIKSDKHTSFYADNKNIKNDTNIEEEKYEYRKSSPVTEVKSLNTSEDFVRESNSNIANSYGSYEISSNIKNRDEEYQENNIESNEIKRLKSPIVYSMSNAFDSSSNEFYLEPGPPPEIGYIPKESVTKTREPVAERVKKLESCHRELSPVEIPPGAVKIFPTIIPRHVKENVNLGLQKKYLSCVKEYKNMIERNPNVENKNLETDKSFVSNKKEMPNIKISKTEQKKKETEKGISSEPIYRPSATNVELRPQSPKPSAEGVYMEKLWSHKKISEESFIRPVTPFSLTGEEKSQFKITDLKHSLTTLSSTEDVVSKEKQESSSIDADKYYRPHSVIGISNAVTNNDSEQCLKLKKKILNGDRLSPFNSTEDKPNYKSETRHMYRDIRKVNDQVISEKNFNETVITNNGLQNKSVECSISEENANKKIANKKFKWPPQEVSFEESLVRKTGNNFHKSETFEKNILLKPCYSPEIGYSHQFSNTEKQSYVRNIEKLPKTISFFHEKQESNVADKFNINQTLPRSFKFASSGDSKFKPVKPYSPYKTEDIGKQKIGDSDYENDSEVIKISNQATIGKAVSQSPHNVSHGSQRTNEYSSSGYSVNNEIFKENIKNSDKNFTIDKSVSNKYESQIVENKSIDKTVTRESGYAADIDEPRHLKSVFLQKNTNYCKPAYSSSNFNKFNEEAKAQTIPRISDNKIFRSFNDDIKITSNLPKKIAPTSFVPIQSSSKFVKSEYRESDYESDYDNRIPPIWRPSDSEPEEPCYRPVRPVLTPVQRPYFTRTFSADSANTYKVSEIKTNFQPVSPVTEYSSSVKIKPTPAFSNHSNRNAINDKQFFRSFSGSGGDASKLQNESFQKQALQKQNSYDRTYEERISEFTDQTSMSKHYSEIQKTQKVEEIRKHFENRSSSISGDFSYSYENDAKSTSCKSRIPIDNDIPSKKNMDFSESQNNKSKSQQFIDNIVNNVSSKQKELKQGALKSPSLYSPTFYEPQVFKEHGRFFDHASSNESNWISDITRSTEAEYVVINGKNEVEGNQKAPIFTTPLHDIAAVIGSLARFECIVHSDSPVTIEWRNNGEILQNSELCQISFRNGVCRLTRLKTYKCDTGTYLCIATNSGGRAETSATLTVSGERRSFIKK